MSDDQMRQMARALASAGGKADGGAGEGGAFKGQGGATGGMAEEIRRAYESAPPESD